MGLRPAETTMRADLMLEGGHLIVLGVVHAVDHEVARRGEACGAAHQIDRRRSERAERIIALDLSGVDQSTPGGAEYDGSVRGSLHEYEADAWMGDQAGHEFAMALVDLFECESAVTDGQIDQPEVARGENRRSGVGVLQVALVAPGSAEPRR